MKAILLAAGVGKRMGPDAGPKCLLEVGGWSLLAITLETLRAVGIRDLVLVAGFRREKVEAHARAHAGNLHVTVLENPRYREGAILSLWTARSHFDDDLLIMDADVLCPQAFFERLISSPHANCILVDPSAVNTGEEQMVLGKGNRVLFITKRPSEQMLTQMSCFGESIGFLKLERAAARFLRQFLEAKVEQGIVNIEHEQVYPDLFEKIQVGFETTDGLPWIEIDTPADLDRAIRMLSLGQAEGRLSHRMSSLGQAEGRLSHQMSSLGQAEGRLSHQMSSSRRRGSSDLLCLNRRVSRWFLPWILRLPLTPNQWTTLSLGIGLASIALIARGGYGNGLVGAALFQLFYIVDNWDGEVARAKGLSSTWGGWFDVGVDAVVQICLGLSLAVGLRKQGAPPWIMTVGWFAVMGLALDFAVTAWAKLRGFGPGVLGDPARHRHFEAVRLRNLVSNSKVARWIQINWTNENFSLIVAGALLLDLRIPFLILLAAGVHLYWLQFLWKERRRLLYWGAS